MKIVSAEKKLFHKLVDECAETVEKLNLAKINLVKNENKYKCSSCTLYIVPMIEVFTFCIGVGTYFVYHNWSLVKNVSCIKFDNRTQTTIY